VIALDGPVDYRLRALHPRHDYFSPLSFESERGLQSIYAQLSADVNTDEIAGDAITINGRAIKVRRKSPAVIWFDFMALCDGPRSQLDYIEISQMNVAVIISDIPFLGGDITERKIAIGTEDSRDNSIAFVNRTVQQGHYDDAARRFIALVDEFYDSGVRLIISAAAAINELYLGGRVSFEFQRTISRIIEMQSEEYSRAD